MFGLVLFQTKINLLMITIFYLIHLEKILNLFCTDKYLFPVNFFNNFWTILASHLHIRFFIKTITSHFMHQ
jgi:hypothetical protein